MKLLSRNKCDLRHSPEAVLEAVAMGGGRLNMVVNAVIEDLCKCKYFERTVFKYVLNNGGTRHKAEEIIEDGLIKLSELIRRGKYEGGKMEAYAIQICKNCWLNMRRKKDEQVVLTDDLSVMDRPEYRTPETRLTTAEKASVLGQVLAQCLGQTCRQLLQLKLIEGKRHDEIAEILNLASANSSKDKLNRCKKSALKCIEGSDKYKRLLESVDFFVKKESTYGNKQLQ